MAFGSRNNFNRWRAAKSARPFVPGISDGFAKLARHKIGRLSGVKDVDAQVRSSKSGDSLRVEFKLSEGAELLGRAGAVDAMMVLYGYIPSGVLRFRANKNKWERHYARSPEVGTKSARAS